MFLNQEKMSILFSIICLIHSNVASLKLIPTVRYGGHGSFSQQSSNKKMDQTINRLPVILECNLLLAQGDLDKNQPVSRLLMESRISRE